ncbi:hypothetical protein Acr_03g0015150 [Actinidia rufa]|uniref:Uncharacterized protein n=1 Tax=Actinidia rufa TaxID=165716 RepID=A0A7J0EE32_9ERIC|nr:hypothetical protein Acr_03g0015150 [Actinidia rufa]
MGGPSRSSQELLITLWSSVVGTLDVQPRTLRPLGSDSGLARLVNLQTEFKPTCTSGILTLPPIIIDDTTKSMLLNLAAYEACPDNANDFGVTSYICFMDSIIDHAEDVKKLRSNGILLNFLGSDEQVANRFNEIATELAPSPHSYVQVEFRIEEHHKSSMKTWIAEWHHTYFRSP